MGWGIDFPYTGKKNYVITRKQGLSDTQNVDFISKNHLDFISQLKNEAGKDIWVIGGGQINKMLLDANLLDEIQVFVMPIILAEGIELFADMPKETSLTLIETRSYSTGAVEINYKVN